jgi:hypothetical protein
LGARPAQSTYYIKSNTSSSQTQCAKTRALVSRSEAVDELVVCGTIIGRVSLLEHGLTVDTPLVRKDFPVCNSQQSDAEASLAIDSILVATERWHDYAHQKYWAQVDGRYTISDVQIKSEDLPSATEHGDWLAMLLGGSSTFVLRQIDAAILAKQESGPTIKLGNFLLVGECFFQDRRYYNLGDYLKLLQQDSSYKDVLFDMVLV